MEQKVKATRVVIDSEPFLQINIPFPPEIAAIQAEGISEVLMLIVGFSSVDIEAHEYYTALNKALRQWNVKGA